MVPRTFVVDSSVAVKWTNGLDEELLTQSDKVLMAAQSGKTTLIAPELLKYEVGNALLNKKLDLGLTYESLAILYTLPIVFVPESKKLAYNALQIAKQSGMTYYDATFVSLSLEKKVPLITANPKHQKKYPGVKVIPLKEYK